MQIKPFSALSVLALAASFFPAAAQAGRFGGGGVHLGGGSFAGGLPGGGPGPAFGGIGAVGGLGGEHIPQLGGLRPGPMPELGGLGGEHIPGLGGLGQEHLPTLGGVGGAFRDPAGLDGLGPAHVPDRVPFGAGGESAGSWSGESREGAYTGPRGSVVIGGAERGSVVGPEGNTISAGRAGGIVIGPNGEIRVGGERGGEATTSGGSVAVGSRGAVQAGDGRVTSEGSRGVVALGPDAAGIHVEHGSISAGPAGAVAHGARATAGVGPAGHGFAIGGAVTAAALRDQGAIVRSSFRHYDVFTPAWLDQHPGAWFASGWVAGRAWGWLPWTGYLGLLGYPLDAAPHYYDYGNSVTYVDGDVYYQDQRVATAQEYADQAAAIAAAGVNVADPGDRWSPLGVFAVTHGDETTSDDVFQLAIDAAGTIRGNYYNAVSDSTEPVSGSVDRKAQRVAWTIAGRKSPVFETGLYNLTQSETTALVHFGHGREEQYRLFRVGQPESTSDSTSD